VSASLVAFPSSPSRKSENNADSIVSKQMDELFRLSQEERDRQLGANWYQDIEHFYSLTGISSSAAPSFRPRVVIPELQTLMLAEATDISESSPKVFLMNKGKRDKPREKAFQEHWRQQQYNLQIFLAELWALFCGTGFLQIGVDPEGRRGKGEVWMICRDGSATYPDPGCLDREHWVYVGWEDKMYLDEICRLWPEAGARLRRQAKGYVSARVGSDDNGPGGLSLPEGPMRFGSGNIPQQRVLGDGRLVVRQLYINDYATEALSESERKRIQEMLGPLTPSPEYRMKFPNGRWIVECEQIVLADGDNGFPFKLMPIIPVQSMPKLKSFWVPPPVRYSKSLQELAERMLTGVFENAVRTNNGQWFIDERTGIDAGDFGALPGEIRIINSGSPVPEVKWPQPMPAHFTQLPEMLLSKQRMVHGFTPQRSGQPGAGNIGQDLFDASVFQSQVLTRMRSKLLAPSLQQAAEMVYYTMCRYYTQEQSFPGFGKEFEMVPWTPAPGDWASTYDIYLDPGSIKPLSASYLRSLVSVLMDKGKLPLGDGLEMLDFPDAEGIAERQKEEMELAAVSRLKKPR
jgi:hypothetical protein